MAGPEFVVVTLFSSRSSKAPAINDWSEEVFLRKLYVNIYTYIPALSLEQLSPHKPAADG